MTERTLYEQLQGADNITLSVEAVKEFGPHSAIFLCALLRIHDSLVRSNQLQPDEFFSVTVDRMREETKLGRDAQDTAVGQLQQRGYFTMQIKGIPPTRRFKLNADVISRELHLVPSAKQQFTAENPDASAFVPNRNDPDGLYRRESKKYGGEIPKENQAEENTPDPEKVTPLTPKNSGIYYYISNSKYSTSYISSKDDIHSVQPQPGGCSEEFFYGHPQVRSFTVEPTAVEPTADSRLAESTESSSCESTPSCSREAPARSVSSERRGGVTLRNTHPTTKAPAPKTKRSAQQKVNAFITRCEKQAAGFQFDKQVLSSLSTYFRMLAGSGALLPEETIKQQLTELATVPSSDRVQVIQDTVSSGWKSLRYAIQQTKQQGTRKSSTHGDWSTISEDAKKELELERERRPVSPNYNSKEVF